MTKDLMKISHKEPHEKRQWSYIHYPPEKQYFWENVYEFFIMRKYEQHSKLTTR